MQIGYSDRSGYDGCAYNKRLTESTAPLNYQLYQGKFESCGKCREDLFWAPQDLVDVESELDGRKRPLSQCDKFKYSPQCVQNGLCTSTYDPRVPVVFAPEVCPIVTNNIPKIRYTGIRLNNPNFCRY